MHKTLFVVHIMDSTTTLPTAHADAIRTLMAAYAVPGLALAVVADGQIAATKVLGVTQQTAMPLTESSLFQAASLSKPVFAYGVLRLCEQGALDLDTPLATIAPDKALADPQAALITARHVLCHTTGWPNWREETESDNLVTQAAPGTRFGYSGEGYEYLQRVIVRITDKPLEAFLHETVLIPLGMQLSRFGWGVDEQGEELRDADGIAAPSGTRIIASAAWSLLTTATDYARFMLATLYPPVDDPQRLSPTSVAAMMTPSVLVGQHAQLAWGLGWGVQQTTVGRSFWQWGGPQNGYSSYAVGFPERQIGLVVLTNGEAGHQICEAVAQIALDMPGVAHPAFDWIVPTEHWRADGFG